MPLLQGDVLKQVVQLFERRGVRFYHACQLKDFRSNVALGGVPSRHLMEQTRSPFTAFDSDDADRRSGAWSKVFGNLSDFGFPFAYSELKNPRTAPTPVVYGPVLLVMRPATLLEASDVAICLRSAGAQGFDRTVESLGTVEDVEKLFASEYVAGERYANAYIKYSEPLRQEFAQRVGAKDAPGWKTLNPEISCTTEQGKLTFAQLDSIVVDSHVVNDSQLLNAVEQCCRDAGVRTRIWPRRYRPGANREAILADLGRVGLAGAADLAGFAATADLSEQSRDWAGRLVAGNLGWQFDRYLRYLREGTLTQL